MLNLWLMARSSPWIHISYRPRGSPLVQKFGSWRAMEALINTATAPPPLYFWICRSPGGLDDMALHAGSHGCTELICSQIWHMGPGWCVVLVHGWIQCVGLICSQIWGTTLGCSWIQCSGLAVGEGQHTKLHRLTLCADTMCRIQPAHQPHTTHPAQVPTPHHSSNL